MTPCWQIIAHMHMDMTTYLHICHFEFIIPLVETYLDYGSMSAYYCSHGYGYDYMSAYLLL